MAGGVVVLGVFVADMTFRGARAPRMGETLIGDSFALGPGGKGSNQAIAIARAGGQVQFLTRLGDDPFADLGEKLWREAGVEAVAPRDTESFTGAASIFVERESGNNAITVAIGAAERIAPAHLEAEAERIRSASVFLTQLEQPIEAARKGLEIAHEAGVTTILNPAPAPAGEFPYDLLPLCDYVTPNETETEAITGRVVTTLEEAEAAARLICEKGAGAALITLGAQGVLFHDGQVTRHVPAMAVGDVIDTTGAGDAFNGGLAKALAEGATAQEAMAFGTATAGLSVTRAGAAASMPSADEIEAALRRG